MKILLVLVLFATLSLPFAQNHAESLRNQKNDNEGISILNQNEISLAAYQHFWGDSNLVVQSDSPFTHRFTIVNFWAPWCPPCLKEMPELEAFFKRNQQKGILVIGITGIYRRSDREDPEKYFSWSKSTLEKLKISYPVIIDDKKRLNAQRFHAQSFPLTILIDHQSKVIDYRTSVKGARSIMKKVEKQLKNAN